jgi:hypothetical protein
VYVGAGGPGQLDGSDSWSQSDAGTWWLLEHNGHLVGVTALHLFRFGVRTYQLNYSLLFSTYLTNFYSF